MFWIFIDSIRQGQVSVFKEIQELRSRKLNDFYYVYYNKQSFNRVMCTVDFLEV